MSYGTLAAFEHYFHFTVFCNKMCIFVQIFTMKFSTKCNRLCKRWQCTFYCFQTSIKQTKFVDDSMCSKKML